MILFKKISLALVLCLSFICIGVGNSAKASSPTDAQYVQIQQLLVILQQLRAQLAMLQKNTTQVPVQTNASIHSQLETFSKSFNNTAPTMIDAQTRLESSTVPTDNKIIYKYTIVNNNSIAENQAILANLYPVKLSAYCKQPDIGWYRDNNVPMVWNFYSPNNQFIATYEADNAKCSQQAILDNQMMEKNLTVTTGRATINAAYLSPFTIKVTATFNTIKDCRAGVIYKITYDDNKEPETVTTDGSCQPQPFVTYHTFEPMQRNYNASIEMYAVRDNSWTHFIQAAKLIRINNNGSMTIESNDPASWKKG
jgi:hypothetical protein